MAASNECGTGELTLSQTVAFAQGGPDQHKNAVSTPGTVYADAESLMAGLPSNGAMPTTMRTDLMGAIANVDRLFPKKSGAGSASGDKPTDTDSAT